MERKIYEIIQEILHLYDCNKELVKGIWFVNNILHLFSKPENLVIRKGKTFIKISHLLTSFACLGMTGSKLMPERK